MTTNYLQPTLVENGREPVSGKSMVYNIKDRKGKVLAGSTRVQNNMFMGKQITTVTDSTFYIEDCIFTSCDPSKFYLGSKQVKIIYGDKVIAKATEILLLGASLFSEFLWPFSLILIKKGALAGLCHPLGLLKTEEIT